MHLLLLLITLVYNGAAALGVPTFDCVVQPTLQLEAGVSNLTNMINLPMGRQCEATLYFSDPSFLPMTFSFNATSCEGKQVNNFQVPRFSPNGEVDVIWRCSNMATSCSHAEVFGGKFNESMTRHMIGEVGCLQEVMQTRTTFITYTRTSGTVVKTVTTVATVPTTVYLSSSRSVAGKGSQTVKVKTPITTQESETVMAAAKTGSTDQCPEAPTCSPVPTPGDAELPSSDVTELPVIRTPLPTESGPAESETSKAVKDTVFVSKSSRIMIPAVTVSLFTTITATVTQRF